MNKNFLHLVFLYIWLPVFMTACATNTEKLKTPQEIETETIQINHDTLLDVGIVLFDKGELTEKQKTEQGLNDEIRQAESRFMAYHLKETMQRANGWGSIQVLPESSYVTDVIVQCSIISSNGEELIIKTAVADSTGKQWLEKSYKIEADHESYRRARPGRDIYQYLYNRIANDIRRYRKKLSNEEITNIRHVSELRYASSISPEPFANYLNQGPSGQTTIVRLPAENDPMLDRVRKVREREFIFIDALNQHYYNFYTVMWDPYEDWRKYYLLEAEQRRLIEREANKTKLVAAIVFIHGLFSGPMQVVAGGMMYKAGQDLANTAEIHNETIRELGGSLQAEVSPMVIEIQGRTVELTGSIEDQYQQWRELLREIYINETGFALDDSVKDSENL